MRTLSFEHRGQRYELEVDDYGDSESSDTISLYGPDGTLLSSYDTCLSGNRALIAEALREIDG